MMITPNHLTFIRILIALSAPFLLLLMRSFPIDFFCTLLFTLACVTDWWDGYLARKKSMVSRLGKILDPIADKMLILSLLLVFCYFQLYSFVWMVLILAREILVTVTRLILLGSGKVIPAEQAGKIKVGFQIGAVYASFLYLMALDSFSPLVLIEGTRVLTQIGIVLANLMTVYSGFLFFKRLIQKR